MPASTPSTTKSPTRRLVCWPTHLLAAQFRRRRLSAALLTASECSDPAHPSAISAWPAKQFPETIGGRPRSTTLVITRHDGTPVAA